MKTKIVSAGMLLLVAAIARGQTIVPGPRIALPSNAPLVLTATATNDLTSTLQRGLFEEEGNRDLDAAISAYQALAAQFDQSRQVAATAIFRLGECYRKLGRTNEAAAQYERIVREFSDQQTLVTLSRQNITGLGKAAQTLVSASSGGDLNLENLQSQYALLKAQLDEARAEKNNEFVAELLNENRELSNNLRMESSNVVSAQSMLRAVNALSVSPQHINQEEKKLAAAEKGVEEARLQIFRYQELRLKILESAIQQARAGQLQTLTLGENETPATSAESQELERMEQISSRLKGWSFPQLRKLIPTVLPDAQFDRLVRELTIIEAKRDEARRENRVDDELAQQCDQANMAAQEYSSELLRKLQDRITSLKKSLTEQKTAVGAREK